MSSELTSRMNDSASAARDAVEQLRQRARRHHVPHHAQPIGAHATGGPNEMPVAAARATHRPHHNVQAAGVGAPSGVDGNGPKRFSVQRKMAIVARLLRGEPLELVARETNVSIARLTEWRERALAGAPISAPGAIS
jgi:hypothetical protein